MEPPRLRPFFLARRLYLSTVLPRTPERADTNRVAQGEKAFHLSSPAGNLLRLRFQAG